MLVLENHLLEFQVLNLKIIIFVKLYQELYCNFKKCIIQSKIINWLSIIRTQLILKRIIN